ncbi:HAD family hydrolase [Staphylococcus sp. 17KM0847]|uniref:HAD family hydrolase n=1 Tax=Staphylococcus sp. 17KM0847 TaxID=2583989 RepID=UPI0015DD0E41|nr:HAD family hydrolase [Staphylococcus sp. 17KM0847]QLK86548.1 HAD family hydrolase [Staphylococcus sp. 17KM0847]
MQQIKAIFLDMDGTILRENNRVSSYTADTIARLRSVGYKVFLATGRAKEEIHLLIPETLRFDGMITSNGTVGHIGEQILFQHGLSVSSVQAIVKQAQEAGIYYEIFPFDAPRFACTEDQTWMLPLVEGDKPESVGMSEWLSRQEAVESKLTWQDRIPDHLGYSKIYLFHPDLEKIAMFREKIRGEAQTLDIEVSQSTPNNVETMAYQVNKGTGVQEMCAEFEMNLSEALVMGDSYNDYTMFKLKDVSAVAMKNANDTIKDMACHITALTHNQDGAAVFLEQHFLKDV